MLSRVPPRFRPCPMTHIDHPLAAMVVRSYKESMGQRLATGRFPHPRLMTENLFATRVYKRRARLASRSQADHLICTAPNTSHPPSCRRDSRAANAWEAFAPCTSCLSVWFWSPRAARQVRRLFARGHPACIARGHRRLLRSGFCRRTCTDASASNVAASTATAIVAFFIAWHVLPIWNSPEVNRHKNRNTVRDRTASLK